MKTDVLLIGIKILQKYLQTQNTNCRQTQNTKSQSFYCKNQQWEQNRRCCSCTSGICAYFLTNEYHVSKKCACFILIGFNYRKTTKNCFQKSFCVIEGTKSSHLCKKRLCQHFMCLQSYCRFT